MLGLARIVWLGYADSGMTGWEQNDARGRRSTAPTSTRPPGALADVLDEEDADFLVGYDWHGGYGHPDHVQGPPPGAPRGPAGTPYAAAAGVDDEPHRHVATLRGGSHAAGMEMATGAPTTRWTTATRSAPPRTRSPGRWTSRRTSPQKRGSLEAHKSQASDIDQFLSMPPEVFARFFGSEHYIEPGVDGPMRRGWPFGA